MDNYFQKIFKESDIEEKSVIYGLNNPLSALFVYNKFLKENKDIYVVTSSLYQANLLKIELEAYTKDVLLFTSEDFLTKIALTTSPELNIERMLTIKQIILSNERKIIITDLYGYLMLMPSKDDYLNSLRTIELNNTINREEFIQYLYNIGYEKVLNVEKTGEFAVRGFVIDIFLIEYANPIRIEFFDEEVESIKNFDIETQLSNVSLNKIDIFPIKLESSNSTSITSYSKNYKTIIYDYQLVLTTYEKLENDYFEYNSNVEKIEKDFKNLDVHNEYICTYLVNLDSYNILNEYNQKSFSSHDVPNFYENISLLEEYIETNKNKTIIIALDKHNLLTFKKNAFNFEYIETNENKIFDNKVNLIKKNINMGFNIGDLVVIGVNNLYKQKLDKYKNNFKMGTKIKNLDSLNRGDYVIHINSGIGIYDGLQKITRNNISKDYLRILYKSDAKLYVPVEKINMITLYNAGVGIIPKVHELGGSTWQKTKIALKKKLEEIAKELLHIEATRKKEQGFKFSKDTKEQYLFEEDFQYKMTSDQEKVTKEIKKDLENINPMDRLLCGDVGYGKTEVAFRAMFKAIMDNKQVMYLCPTTILSNQQYMSAIERFKNFPVNIELLNRFTTKKEQTRILRSLKEGKIDILIGTHRILSEDIFAKDIGLLIIDEEQRFGVKHKEKIKQSYPTVDILTLSATPIPRTLQMSLSSLKQLSLINTAPVDRYPVVTHLINENDYVLKDAIYKELSRNGQIFILYNKVETIETKLAQIQKLVPEARITYAHGQMSKKEIEDKMINFINHEYDILLCTTIIETGIDIPNANTLIVIDADHFGLAQLYQIRGRVGRSNKIAYCYLMYKKNKMLSEVSVKRLETIKNFTNLGSGFKIAMQDLNIRGAGDILGKQQSGFIASVGIDLYLKMLQDEVYKLNNEAVEEIILENPLIEVSTHIDDTYTTDEEIKLELHNLINTVDSYERLEVVASQIKDRFGKIDENIYVYMYEEWFEKLSSKLNITKVRLFNNILTVVLPKVISPKIDGNQLLEDCFKLDENIKLTYRDECINISLNTLKTKEHYLKIITKLLEKIVNY